MLFRFQPPNRTIVRLRHFATLLRIYDIVKFITFSSAPALTANVQVGEGPVAPTFNVGGQFDPNSNNGIPIAPVVGTGLK